MDNILYLNDWFGDYFHTINFHKKDPIPITSQEKEIHTDL